MTAAGYYRFPTIHNDTAVFTCEDDLWTVSTNGGIARRLTSGLGSSTRPALSPDGKWLAFSGGEEGPWEVFVMPAEGGQPRRLTFAGINCYVTGWTPDGKILYDSQSGQPFNGLRRLYAIAPDGGEPTLLPVGPASFISFSATNGRVIQRPSSDPANWKRYRGGTAGVFWVDPAGKNDWQRLSIPGNPARPIWIGQRIYFIGDHEGTGNLYSCTPDGGDIRRHTHHADFYVRTAQSDGRRLIYHAGGDLFVFDPRDNSSKKIEVDYRSPRTPRNRKFVDAARYLESFSVHPHGHMIALTSRGKIATLGNWEGPVQQHGEPFTGRYRLATWLNDGKRLAAVRDSGGSGESLVIFAGDELTEPQVIAPPDGMDLGRIIWLIASPKADQLLLANVRNEVILVDLPTKTFKVIDQSKFGPCLGFSFSPDGKWIAYALSITFHTAIIKLARLEDGATFDVSRPVLLDKSPVFDPEGKYLYFISSREFNPVYDALHFDLGFPRGTRPYAITLRKDLPNPFVLTPKPPETTKPVSAKDEDEKADAETKKAEAGFTIDLDGIQDRVVAFPVPEGKYQQIDAIKGKVLYTYVAVEGALSQGWLPGEPEAKATLEMYDLEHGKCETIVKEISYFALSQDHKTLVIRAGRKLRALKAGEKSDEALAREGPGRKSGWIDLKRVRLSVNPTDEYRQMYDESWRLQRDQFWTEDMSGVEWQRIYDRYRPLLDRVSTRSEIADLLWEMQGELGSSHAYVLGGDYRDEPRYDVGFLGAEFSWNVSANGWKIDRILRGDSWLEDKSPPLLRPGVNVREGESILAVNGRRASAEMSPRQLLVHQAGVEVALTVADATGQNPRTVTVKTLRNETPLRYREWVEANRAKVHQRTGERCGYVHIPDMGPNGYAEFHRYFLAESDRDGLVIDVRFNGGGHVSALLLEKLARRRLAYVQTRWFGRQPWPEDSAAGPMIALTNEFAGSDGDIFSHNFKGMKLGPLIGKRTWGGVIGIWPRQTLIDGGVNTVPEFAFHFQDVGWKVENYGVDPDIEVEMRPQNYLAHEDPQMDRGLTELLKLLETAPRPTQAPRPRLTLPGELRSP